MPYQRDGRKALLRCPEFRAIQRIERSKIPTAEPRCAMFWSFSVQRNNSRFAAAVDDTATMPRFSSVSTPTVPNSGMKLAPEIFAVWLTTHAVGVDQSRSTQNITLLVSVPCDPHPVAHGPEPRPPCK